MSTGRSPYPTRSRRRQQALQQQQLATPGSASAIALDTSQASTNMIQLDDSFATTSISPRHSLASAASSTNSYRFGQSLVQARLSPRNTSAMGAPPASTRRSFFDIRTKPKEPTKTHEDGNTTRDDIPVATPKQPQGTVGSATRSKLEVELKDNIDLTNLRQMALSCLGQGSPDLASSAIISTSPSMAVFFASMVYAKTLSKVDALLYAKALFLDQQAKRCVRLLEQTGVFTPPSSSEEQPLNISIRLEAALVAVQALASLDDWPAVLGLLEEAYLYQTDSGHYSNLGSGLATSPAQLILPSSIEDDDDIAWQNLAERIQPKQGDSIDGPMSGVPIHPLSRVCYWRGRAYLETGNPTRAAKFYQRALQIDGYCVDALDGLLDHSVVAPAQALQVIQHITFPPGQEWLRAMYLAKVHVVAPTATAEKALEGSAAGAKANENSMSQEDGPFWQDASSIQLLTPITATGQGETSRRVFFGSTTVKDLPIDDTDEKMLEEETKEVEGALDNLLHHYKFEHSSQVLAMAAQRAYQRSNLPVALKYCQALAQSDPLCLTAAYVHVSTLVALGHKRTLFQLAHEWVEAAPKSARAWFAVGSYYYACERYHIAQRHFCRATRLAPQVIEAWIAFGTSFAACDESDQALASFRAAQRLAPGDPTSLLYIGMEYLRTNHTSLAEHFLLASYRASRGTNRLCLNELGVWNMSKKEFARAIDWFIQALGGSADSRNFNSDDWKDENKLSDLLDGVTDPYWESTLFNLAHAYRKTRQYHLAILCLTRSLSLKPNNASSLAALAFCEHLRGNLDMAIDTYHAALAQKPDDPFATDMLQRALQDSLEHTTELFAAAELEGPLFPKANNTSQEQSTKAPMGIGRPSVGSSSANRSYNDSSFFSADGLSISVESTSDVDMG